MKKTNSRTSIITRKKYDAKELVRFTFNNDTLEIAPLNIKGRGYYLEKDHKLLSDPKTYTIISKRFNKATNIKEFLESLKHELDNY